MSDGSGFPIRAGASAADVLARLQSQLADLDRESARLAAERTKIVAKIDIAQQFLAIASEAEAGEPALPEAQDFKPDLVTDRSDPEVEGDEEDDASDPASLVSSPDKMTWVEAVTRWVSSEPHGITHAELRDLMMQSEFGERFKVSEKGYYNALSRLQRRGTIKKYRGRLYSEGTLAAYLKDVEAGRIELLPDPVVGAYSPMGEAILDIVHRERLRGVTGVEIIRELKTDPEFGAALTPHHTGAFNIIARLQRRKQIIRNSDSECFPGPQMAPRSPDSKWLRHGAGGLL